MPAHNLGEAVAIADREGKEGVVVRILSDDPSRQMQIKIKQQDYLVLHRLVAGFGEKVVRQAIMSCAATFADLDRVALSGTYATSGASNSTRPSCRRRAWRTVSPCQRTHRR